MKLSRLHHVAVICSDYPRSLEFYTKTSDEDYRERLRNLDS